MNEQNLPEVGYAMSEQAYDDLDLLQSQLLTLTALITPETHGEPPDLILPRVAVTICITELAQRATRLKEQLQWYSVVKPEAA